MSQTAPAALLLPDPEKLEIVTAIVGEAYTLTAADDGLWLRTLSDDPMVITVPPEIDEAFPAFARVTIERAGLGAVSFVGGSGVTINSAFGESIDDRYAVAILKRVDVDEWTLAFLPADPVMVEEYVGFALSDEETALTAKVAATYAMVADMVLTSIKLSLGTASSAGDVTVTVKRNGVSVTTGTPTIAAGATLSGPVVIAESDLLEDDAIVWEITGAGTGAKGLKGTLIGYAP